MANIKGKVIGIDLGTSFSAVSVMEGGKPVIIPNAEGQRTTPSVVAVTKDGERLVGQVARNQAITNPEHTVRSIKRHMGEHHNTKIWDKDYSPQEISAMILQKLKSDAEAYLGQKVENAVITVPAYFTDAQRQATKDAGKIAGLNVLRIINEPTAASLAYGLDKSNEHTILVFDFGGGTFDVSVLEIDDGTFEVKATSGDNRLGGDDIDELLMDWMADEFKKTTGINLKEDKTAVQRLKEAAEKAKIELSSKTATEINLPFITADAAGPKHLQLSMSRAKFETMIADILKRLETPTKQALKDCGLDEVDKIVFVGGSTRIPAVEKLVKELTHKEGDKSVNPDEAVSLGAAIQGGVLAGEVKDILLLDVTPLTLGIETLGGVLTKLIERNTTIPTKKSQIFSTAADNQPAVTIHVLQGERAMAQDNKSLGKFDLTGIPPSLRGIPQIEVTFDIDANGIVNVSAKDLGTSIEQKITITSSTNLSEAEVEKMKKDAETHAEDDKKRKDEVDTINEADSLVFQGEKTLKEMEGKVSEDKIKAIKEKIEELKKFLEESKKDFAKIKPVLEETNKLMQDAAQELYQHAAQAQEAAKESGEKPGDGKKETVVDAEYKVDDEKKEDKKEEKKEEK